MELHIYHHILPAPGDPATTAALRSINQKLEQIMASQKELADQLTALTGQVTKSKQEIIKKIADLETALANAGSTSTEVDKALAALKTEVQGVDDLHPDAPPE